MQRLEGKAVHKGGECEGGSEPGFLGVTLGRAAGTGDEGEDGCEFPQAAGVPAVLESVVVSFGCAGAGPAASSRHRRPPMVGEGYVDLWVGGWEGDGRSETLNQEDNDTCVDAVGPPKRMFCIGGNPG